MLLKATKVLFDGSFFPINRDPSLSLGESQEKKRGGKRSREKLMDIKIITGDRHPAVEFRLQNCFPAS